MVIQRGKGLSHQTIGFLSFCGGDAMIWIAVILIVLLAAFVIWGVFFDFKGV